MQPIKTLLLSGANNHDWERSTPFFAGLLRSSGRFDVTVTEDPSSALGDSDALAAFDLLFSDYNGPQWSNAAKANFESAVASGTGLVIVHAADNAFPGWVEYEKMTALLWREGTGHGQFHEFPASCAPPRMGLYCSHDENTLRYMEKRGGSALRDAGDARRCRVGPGRQAGFVRAFRRRAQAAPAFRVVIGRQRRLGFTRLVRGELFTSSAQASSPASASSASPSLL